MVERGQIQFEERSKQIEDYSGLRYGNITPSDIDGCVEFDGRLFVFMEFKTPGAPFKYGQRLMIERVVDCIAAAPNVTAVAAICEHSTPVWAQIDCGAAIVSEFRHNGEWKQTTRPVSLREFVDSAREKMLRG